MSSSKYVARDYRDGNKKKYWKSRVHRSPALKDHYFKETWTSSSTAGGSGTLSQGFSFALADLNNYTLFTGLFDLYKICGIKVRMVPNANTADFFQADNSGSSDKPVPTYFYIVDKDDATAPASATAMLLRPECKSGMFDRVLSVYFRPHVANMVYNTPSVPTAYAPTASQWIDMSYPAVPHYGFKVYFSGAALQTFVVTFQVTVYFKCRSIDA